jgi:hypothetical protein
MNLSTIFFTLLYGGAIVFIILYLFRSQQPPVVIYPVATSIDYPNVVYSDSSLWPFPITNYNYWPYWNSWSGGYGYRHIYPRGGHRRDRPWGGMNRSANRSAPRSGGRVGGGRQ